MPKGIVDVLIAFNTDTSGLVEGTRAIQRYSQAADNLGSSTALLQKSSQNLTFALNEQDKILSTRLVKHSFDLIDKQKQLYGPVNQYTRMVDDLNGSMIKYNYTLQQITHTMDKSGKLIPLSPAQLAAQQIPIGWQTANISSRPATQREVLATRGPSGFLERLNPFFGEEDKLDIAGLIKRAAFTVPTWMAVRAAMNAVFDIIPSGIERFRELDQAIAEMRIQTNLKDWEAAGNTIEQFSARSRNTLQSLSRETGLTAQQLSETFRVFSESGASVEVAFAGMETAAKGSIGSLTDSKALAQFLIDAYRLFGNTVTEATTPQDKLNYMMGVTNKLFQENTGSLKNYVDSFATFSGVAKTWGLTFKETITLIVSLTNAAQKGQANGTQLTRAFQELTKNRLLFNEYLKNQEIKASGRTNFEILYGVIAKLSKELNNPSTANAVTELFGAKSQKGVLGLAAQIDKLKKNLEGLKTFSLGDALAINQKQFEIRMNTVNQQLLRMKVITQDITVAFVSGLLNIQNDDPVEVLKSINTELNKMVISAREVGQEFRNLYDNPLIKVGLALILWRTLGIGKALNSAATGAKAFATGAGGVKLLATGEAIDAGIVAGRATTGIAGKNLVNQGVGMQLAGGTMSTQQVSAMGRVLQNPTIAGLIAGTGLVGMGIVIANLGKLLGAISTPSKIAAARAATTLPAFAPAARGAISFAGLLPAMAGVLATVTAFVSRYAFIAWVVQITLSNLTKWFPDSKGVPGQKNIFGAIGDLFNRIIGKKEAEQAVTPEVKAPRGPLLQEEFNNLSPEEQKQYTSTLLTPKETTKLQKELLKLQSEEMKQRGALTSEVLKQYDAQARLLNLEEENYDVLIRQLEIQKALNEEKKPKSRLGADTMKLYDIALKGGENIDIAKYIGEYLQGTRDIVSLFDEGSAVASTFKKNWAELFKQKQAEAFLTNDVRVLDAIGGRPRGQTSFWGTSTGLNIPIEEEFIRGNDIMRDSSMLFSDSTKAFSDAVRQFKDIFYQKSGYTGVPSNYYAINPPNANPSKHQIEVTVGVDNTMTASLKAKGNFVGNNDIIAIGLVDLAKDIEGFISGTGGQRFKKALDSYNYGKDLPLTIKQYQGNMGARF